MRSTARRTRFAISCRFAHAKFAAAAARALGHGLRVGALEAPARLRPLDIVAAAHDTAPVDEHPVEVDAHPTALARARRDVARELVHEWLPPLPELLCGERQREQPDAAVDVVADTAG